MKIQHRRTMDSKLETRAEEEKKTIEGYFAVFNRETELWKDVFEEIAPGAFDSSMDRDVRALLNHNDDIVLGRTTAGTLTLKADNVGLWGSIAVNENDTDAMNLYARVQRGDVSQCSFGFNILREATEHRDDGSIKWTLEDVELWEVSPVTFPAYADTGISARKAQVELEEKRRTEQWRANQIAKLRKDKINA